MFDIQTNSFEVGSCLNCGYSGRYRDATPGTSDTVDVFLGRRWTARRRSEWDGPTARAAGQDATRCQEI